MTQKTINIPGPKTSCTIEKIAIFGSADVDEKHPLYQEVFKVARYLAYQGKIVVDGGGPGTMLAATEGAKSAGGKVITVTFFPKDMPEFEGASIDNIPDKEIRTSSYVERMFGLMDEADAFICFQGGTGTLSEWATAWLLAHLNYGNHKPLILYGAFWRELMRVIEDRFFVGDKEKEVYRIVENETELVTALDFFQQDLGSRCHLPLRH